MAAEPQEDELGGSRLACFSGALATCRLLLASASGSLFLASASSSLLAGTSGVLVEELFVLVEELSVAGSRLLSSAISSLLLASASSSLLAGTSGLRVEELLAAGILLLSSASSCLLLASASSSLLAGTSGLLVEELCAASILLLASAGGLFLDEAMVFIRPHVVDGPLPILVRVLRASVTPMKNGPPAWPWQQQSGSLLVFADGALMPIIDAKGPTEGVQGGGLVAFVVVEQPLGGAWGRLRPFELQPPGRIGEGGRGQMGRR